MILHGEITSETVGGVSTGTLTAAKRAKRRLLICNKDQS